MWVRVSNAAYVFIGRIQFLTGYWTEFLGSWVSPWAAHNMAAGSPQKSEPREVSKMKARFFFKSNLRSDTLTVALFYLLEASHNVQPSIEGKALHKDVNTRKWGSWEPSWRLPTTFCCHLRNALWMIIMWEAQIRGWTNLEKERDVGKILWGKRLFSWTLMVSRIRSCRSEWNMFIRKEIASENLEQRKPGTAKIWDLISLKVSLYVHHKDFYYILT